MPLKTENMNVTENKTELPDMEESEQRAEELLSAREIQKIRHERRRGNIRKNSKTCHHVSLDLWTGSWGFDWAG